MNHPLAQILRSSKPAPTVLQVVRQPRVLSGQRFSRLLKGGTQCDAALLPYDLASGDTKIEKPTCAQAARPRVSASLVAKIALLSDAERRPLARRDVTLQEVRKDVLPIDQKLDRIVAKHGPDVLLAALDRATTPAAVPVIVDAEFAD